MPRRSLILLPLSLLILLTGCATRSATDNGLIITHDGRLVADTAEVARSEFEHILGLRAADAAGPGWKSLAGITELPALDAVQADAWGWRHMTVDLTLVPPAAATAETTATALARAEQGIRDAVRYRIARADGLVMTTTVKPAGDPPPGSTHYTTVAGDTLAGISGAFYGTSQHWRTIADANPTIDPGDLQPGTDLVIPPKP